MADTKSPRPLIIGLAPAGYVTGPVRAAQLGFKTGDRRTRLSGWYHSELGLHSHRRRCCVRPKFSAICSTPKITA